MFARAIMSVGLSLNLSHLANLALDGCNSNASMTLNPIWTTDFNVTIFLVG